MKSAVPPSTWAWESKTRKLANHGCEAAGAEDSGVALYGGVHGFKGPFDRERDSGNFGFQEGFNLGAKVPVTKMATKSATRP